MEERGFMLKIVLPLKTVSEANRRDHWSKTRKRSKIQRSLVAAKVRTLLSCNSLKQQRKPYNITIVRHAPRRIRDSDNLARAMKAVRDGVADALKIDDQDLCGRVYAWWSYEQEKDSTYRVSIFIM